jgi:thiol-disulfide isomerase/thioredoxin
MPNQSSFQRVIAFMVVGIGLITVGVAAMTLITLHQSQATSNIIAVPVAVDYPAPALTLSDTEGTSHSLKDYLGQVVLVNMWATWCPPCREEMPTLEAFHEEHSDDGFVIIGLNDGDGLLDVRDFVAEYGLLFPVWLDPGYTSETIFGTTNLPSSYVIDRQGQVRLQWVGAITRDMLDKYVLPIILE